MGHKRMRGQFHLRVGWGDVCEMFKAQGSWNVQIISKGTLEGEVKR